MAISDAHSQVLSTYVNVLAQRSDLRFGHRPWGNVKDKLSTAITARVWEAAYPDYDTLLNHRFLSRGTRAALGLICVSPPKSDNRWVSDSFTQSYK